jgi:P-type Ca2+ transporter type 2C
MRSLTVSPFVAGDPVWLGPEVTTLSELVAALEVPFLDRPGLLQLVPGIALIHSLAAADGRVALRWVHLSHELRLIPGGAPIGTAVVLTASIVESERALRLASRLLTCLHDPEVIEAASVAKTRESLVQALAPADRDGGETPLVSADLLALLGSGAMGLSTDEADRRQRACGPNRLERVRRRPLLGRFLEQFGSFFAVLLWIAGGFAFLAGMIELGWAIFAVIIINGVFSFFQEYRAERAVEALQHMLPREITVLRDGGERRLATTSLVPGDLVRLEEGDQVPADGQLLSAAELRVDQSALTGEPHPVFKLPSTGNDRGNVPLPERQELVFAGTSVVVGSGLYVVRATGMRTEIGAIAHLTQTVVEEPSPLQREMRQVTRVVTILAVCFGAGFFLLGVASGMLPLSDAFLFALGVIVANVPEGLLPTLTLALALGVQRMARQRSLMKRLSSVETLGATTVICTDKTGTLTQNRMSARFVWMSGKTLDVSGPDGETCSDTRELFEAAVLASQATEDRGDPTETAIVSAARRAGLDPEKLRLAHDLLVPYPFDSFRKRMTLVRTVDGGAAAYVKGAPKETLALCDAIRWEGQTLALSEERRRVLLADHDRLAASGLRILAVAVRPLTDELLGAGASVVEQRLTFLGLIALWDPPRPEVKDAIALCRGAGIRVVMITGDYGLTAQAIARHVGLPVDKVITGEELERLAPESLQRLLAEPGVLFARTSPAHKLAIVSALKTAGEVVAVTGDGVNDAPALKAANIGVAMGKRGSEVAKEAAVMVVTDDNFASIVAAVRQGRAIYANMGKFVTYIFASNVPELVPFLAFVLLGIPLPLTVLQILVVDLGTDLLPALALGAEPPEPDVMDRPPRRQNARLLGARRLLHAYAFLGAAEAVFSLGAFFWTYWLAGWRPGLAMAAEGPLYRRATTMTLSAIVAAQVGNVFACRTERESLCRVGLFSNPRVLGGIVAEIGLLLSLVLIPPFATVFNTATLSFSEWGVLLVLPPIMLLLEEGRKWLVRRGSVLTAKRNSRRNDSSTDRRGQPACGAGRPYSKRDAQVEQHL